MDILEDYARKYGSNFAYIYDWDFNTQGSNDSAFKYSPINFNQETYCDFYGVTMFKNHLIQFVIIYEPLMEHNDDHYFNEIFKQYIFYCMNINVLRINHRTNVKKEISTFLKRIHHTTTIYISNKIQVNVSNFIKKCTIYSETVKSFYHTFIENRKIRFKNLNHYNKSHDDEYSDDYDEFYHKLTDNNLDDDLNDNDGIKVSNNVLDLIIKNKSTHDNNKSRVDECIINLLGIDKQSYNINNVESESESDDSIVLVRNVVDDNQNLIDELLKKRVQKKINLDPYLCLNKLKFFNELKNNSSLVSGATYIKYIDVNDAFKNDKYKQHVHCGGIFLNGGVFKNGKFVTFNIKFNKKIKIEPSKMVTFIDKICTISYKYLQI